MNYFTPELYRRYNSPDDAEADRADEDWEQALRAYQSRLASLSLVMNERLKELAENVCLHDAEVLSMQEDVPVRTLPTLPPLPFATVSLRQDSQIIHLVYVVWGDVVETSPPEDWPFSTLRTHWLYDEIDLERRDANLYWHRILLSDGRVVAIPFVDVVVQSFFEDRPEAALVSRKRA